LQYLEFEGLKTSRKSLERIAQQKYNSRLDDESEARLLTILRMVLKDVEAVWDYTLDDKFVTSKQNLHNLEYHLSDLDLLEEDVTEGGVEDVNIWEENPFNIIFENKDIKNIKAASLNQLIIRMTEAAEDYDDQIQPIFLYTYRTFATPEKVLEKLRDRYNTPAKLEKDEKRKIQIRVVNVVRKWIQDHFDDFRNSDKLMKSLEEFIATLEVENPAYAKLLIPAITNREARNRTSAVFAANSNKEPSSVQLNNPSAASGLSPPSYRKAAPEPKVSTRTIFSPRLELTDLDEEEIARQLCLIEFNLYSSIKPSELFNLAWSKPQLKHRSMNVLKMIDRSTKVSQWVATAIVKEERLRNRARLVQKFIKIAQYLFQFNNFSTCMAVLAGLSTASVYRLKWTWNEIPNPIQKVLSDMKEKLESAHAYKVYRQTLATANPPCIPYLGTYLTDLTFIEEGNSAFYKGMINFQKRKLIYDVIEKVMRYQVMPYNFTSVNQIQSLLIDLKRFSVDKEEDLYNFSISREPKNAEKTDLIP